LTKKYLSPLPTVQKHCSPLRPLASESISMFFDRFVGTYFFATQSFPFPFSPPSNSGISPLLPLLLPMLDFFLLKTIGIVFRCPKKNQPFFMYSSHQIRGLPPPLLPPLTVQSCVVGPWAPWSGCPFGCTGASETRWRAARPLGPATTRRRRRSLFGIELFSFCWGFFASLYF